MSAPNPIDLLFGGMEKLGPGDNVHTRNLLHRLPKRWLRSIVDAGCGTGRQTMVLAGELANLVHAVDSYPPFLKELSERARRAGLGHLVQTHCVDMRDILEVFPRVDLLWSEGAAYNIGFANALATWGRAIPQGGFAVVSELAWLRDCVPEQVRQFFSVAYPDMRHTNQNISVAESSGYKVLDTCTLPEDAWVQGYYEILEPRAKALADHPATAVREFARETVKEIEIFRISDNSYGYVFYVLQRG